MIAVPFIYFSLLLLYLYRRDHAITLGFFVVLVYDISALASVLMDVLNIQTQGTSTFEVGLLATMSYCFLLTLGVLPFMNSRKLASKPLNLNLNITLIKHISRISFAFFLIFIVTTISLMYNILTGDIGAMRNAIYSGDSVSWMDHIPSGIKLIIQVGNIFFYSPLPYLFLGLYTFMRTNLSIKYSLFLLLASFITPLIGLLSIDRSNTVYWLLSLIAVYLLMKPYADPVKLKSIRKILVLLASIFLLYLVLVTNSRFGQIDNYRNLSGTQGSIIEYLGQPFINYAFLFDALEDKFYSIQVVFPFYNRFLGINQSSTDLQALITERSGYRIGVFYTYLGHIMTTAGKAIMVIFCFSYFVIARRITNIIYLNELTLKRLFIYLSLASVSFLGLFGNYYCIEYRITTILFFIFFIRRI